MQVKILEKHFGGVEFAPEMRVLHLGGRSSANVETLEFTLPESWQGKSVTLHIQRQDGSLPAPILLDEAHSCAVDKKFTASTCGSWMLLAMGEDGFRALTRPAKYDCYETLATDGDAEISQTQYEAFVAQVLAYSNNAQASAQEARNSAAEVKKNAQAAQEAKTSAVAAAERAETAKAGAESGATRAEAAAKRAENAAPPEDGAVTSVNGKGGNVTLTAEDVGAVPEDSAGYLKKAEAQGRTLIVTHGDGSVESLQLQDSNGVLANVTLELAPDGWTASGRQDYPAKNTAVLETSRELFTPAGTVRPESVEAAQEAGLASFCETQNGSVTFYAKQAAENVIRVQTVIFGTAGDISLLDLATDEEFESMMKELEQD